MNVIFVGGERSVLEYRLSRSPDGAPILGAGRKLGFGRMPSFLCFRKGSGQALVLSEEDNLLTSLVVTPSGLRARSVVPCPGGPAYVSFDRTGRWALVACYGSGEVRAYPILKDGTLDPKVRRFRSGALSHAICPGPRGDELYVSVKGTDELHRLLLDPSQGTFSLLETAKAPQGSGPRHLAFSPDGQRMYVVCENNCTLLVYDLYTEGLHLRQTVSTLPTAVGPGDTGSDLHVSPDGRFVYVSTRGHNSLTVFRTTLAGVERVQNIKTGACPRNFCLLAPELLLCANQEGRSLTFFYRDVETGRLKKTGEVSLSERPFWVGNPQTT